MKVKVGCAMSLVGCVLEDTIELPDDSTKEEIEDAVHEYVYEYFDWWYERVEE